jgi:adenosine kinase
MRIVFSGSIAYDYLMTFPGYFRDHIIPESLDSLSLSFLTDSMTRQQGGTAANGAYNYALLRGKATVLGTVGHDFDKYRAHLASVGVDTNEIVEIADEFTASFFANTDLSNAQIASFYPGAMAHAAQLKLSDLPFTPDLVVISPDDPGAMCARVRECHELNIPYLYDPSQQIVVMEPDDLHMGVVGAHMILLNAYEFSLVQRKLGVDEQRITDNCAVLGITRGEHGAVILAEGDRHDIPAVAPNELLDPTGAGDAFRAGFLRGMDLDLSWEMCGFVGALAATYCLEHVGTQNHVYTPAAFTDRFRIHFDDEGALDALLEEK